MGEQRNRARVAVPEVRGDPAGAAKCSWGNVLRPLLNLVGEAPFSKGVSKGSSKGKLATRSRLAGVALLDGYLIGGTGRLPGLRLTIAVAAL